MADTILLNEGKGRVIGAVVLCAYTAPAEAELLRLGQKVTVHDNEGILHQGTVTSLTITRKPPVTRLYVSVKVGLTFLRLHSYGTGQVGNGSWFLVTRVGQQG